MVSGGNVLQGEDFTTLSTILTVPVLVFVTQYLNRSYLFFPWL